MRVHLTRKRHIRTITHVMALPETDPSRRHTAPQRNMSVCRECSARKIMGNVCRIAGLENKQGTRPTREAAVREDISLTVIPAGCVNGYADLAAPAA